MNGGIVRNRVNICGRPANWFSGISFPMIWTLSLVHHFLVKLYLILSSKAHSDTSPAFNIHCHVFPISSICLSLTFSELSSAYLLVHGLVLGVEDVEKGRGYSFAAGGAYDF